MCIRDRIDGTQVTQFKLEEATKGQLESDPVTASLLQIGAVVEFGSSAEGWLEQVRIWRDIYYMPSQENRGQSQVLVGDPGGFLLLGDNQPVSIDSRHWSRAWVSSGQLIGKVLKKRRR